MTSYSAIQGIAGHLLDLPNSVETLLGACPGFWLLEVLHELSIDHIARIATKIVTRTLDSLRA